MMIVLLLLGSCFYVGLSYDQLEYGNTYRFRLHRRAQTVEFWPTYKRGVKILWSRDEPSPRQSRGTVVGSYFEIKNVTQADNGDYKMQDQDQNVVSQKTLEVLETRQFYSMNPGETLRLSFDMEQSSCNIYFFAEPDNEYDWTQIVHKGRQRTYSNSNGCSGFYMIKPCGIILENLENSCSGQYEVRDAENNKALVVSLEVKSDEGFDMSKIGIGFGVSFLTLGCCTCLKHCCCGKRSSKKDAPETPEADAEPAVHYHEYDHEPATVRPEQLIPPTQTCYPTQPSHTPTDPLIHNPPATNQPPPPPPPPYSEILTGAEQEGAPFVPAHTDPEPQYELKGLKFLSAPPLSEDTSSYSNVYTSDKLNFL